MPMILSGILVASVVAILSGLLLYNMRPTTYEATASSSVRVGDPGHNLVGPSWTGLNRPGSSETYGAR